MIYDVNSPLFRSFLSQKGGSSNKRYPEHPSFSQNLPVCAERFLFRFALFLVVLR
jgi:hypothetical protein